LHDFFFRILTIPLPLHSRRSCTRLFSTSTHTVASTRSPLSSALSSSAWRVSSHLSRSTCALPCSSVSNRCSAYSDSLLLLLLLLLLLPHPSLAFATPVAALCLSACSRCSAAHRPQQTLLRCLLLTVCPPPPDGVRRCATWRGRTPRARRRSSSRARPAACSSEQL
jgi:hypothetical protein